MDYIRRKISHNRTTVELWKCGIYRAVSSCWFFCFVLVARSSYYPPLPFVSPRFVSLLQLCSNSNSNVTQQILFSFFGVSVIFVRVQYRHEIKKKEKRRNKLFLVFVFFLLLLITIVAVWVELIVWISKNHRNRTNKLRNENQEKWNKKWSKKEKKKRRDQRRKQQQKKNVYNREHPARTCCRLAGAEITRVTPRFLNNQFISHSCTHTHTHSHMTSVLILLTLIRSAIQQVDYKQQMKNHRQKKFTTSGDFVCCCIICKMNLQWGGSILVSCVCCVGGLEESAIIFHFYDYYESCQNVFLGKSPICVQQQQERMVRKTVGEIRD